MGIMGFKNLSYCVRPHSTHLAPYLRQYPHISLSSGLNRDDLLSIGHYGSPKIIVFSWLSDKSHQAWLNARSYWAVPAKEYDHLAGSSHNGMRHILAGHWVSDLFLQISYHTILLNLVQNSSFASFSVLLEHASHLHNPHSCKQVLL